MTESASCPADAPSVEPGSASKRNELERCLLQMLGDLIVTLKHQNTLITEVLQQNALLVQSLGDEPEPDEHQSTYLDDSRR